MGNSVSPSDSLAIAEIAETLYGFLPGRPHRFADQSLSFPGVAEKIGLHGFWPGGSKQPAIAGLLERTLVSKRGKFCPLITEIVNAGIRYRARKDPVRREEIERLNASVAKLGFKIPELWSSSFLGELPSQEPMAREPPQPSELVVGLAELRERHEKLAAMEPQGRGFEYERFLKALFDAFGLAGRASFRLEGEQIDGSLELDADTYLVEARWTSDLVGARALRAFSAQVAAKATWSRGLFISDAGFSDEGLHAFSRGSPTRLIGLSGQDIHFILEGEMRLDDALRRKARIAAEEGAFYVSVFELVRGRRARRSVDGA